MAAFNARMNDWGLSEFTETLKRNGYDDMELIAGLNAAELKVMGDEAGMKSGHLIKLTKELEQLVNATSL